MSRQFTRSRPSAGVSSPSRVAGTTSSPGRRSPAREQAFNSFLGNYNNGTLPLAPGAIPWNKGFLRGEWEWRHFDFVATGNYIGDFRDDPASTLLTVTSGF